MYLQVHFEDRYPLKSLKMATEQRCLWGTSFTLQASFLQFSQLESQSLEIHGIISVKIQDVYILSQYILHHLYRWCAETSYYPPRPLELRSGTIDPGMPDCIMAWCPFQ